MNHGAPRRRFKIASGRKRARPALELKGKSAFPVAIALSLSTATSYYVPLCKGFPAISVQLQTSAQAWKLIEKDYTLRLSLVARDWATEHLRAQNAVFAEGRRRGNSGYYGPALVEMEIGDAEKRAEWSYRTCCEIWESQGLTKCRPFFRAIFDRCLEPLFATRKVCFGHELDLHQKRAGAKIPQGVSAIRGHMNREMDGLRAKWNTILEIATRDAENQERLKGQTPVLSGSLPRSGGVDSIFTWRELEIRFRDLHSKTLGQSVSANFIRTVWDSGSVTEEWILGGNAVWRAEFEAVASIAARKLGWTQNEGANDYWLDRVREWMQQAGLDKDKRTAWLPTGTVVESGLSGRTGGLYTGKIAELSAMFCVHLIAHATPETTTSSRHPEVVSQSGPRRPLRKARKTRMQLDRMAAIFGAIQSDLKGRKYCIALDERKVRLPDHWIEEGCPRTYAQAYRETRWRKRIHDEKCRYREEYDKTPAREREAIIQGEKGTRHTRH
jgi:hypothetical protein